MLYGIQTLRQLVPAWEDGASCGTGAVVGHRGELYTATRPVSGREPGLSPGHWALLQ